MASDLHALRQPVTPRFVVRAMPWLIGVLAGLGLIGMLPDWFLRPDLLANQERAEQLAGALDPEHEFEQTFTAGNDGLSAIDVFAAVPPGRLSAPYTLRLALYQGGREITSAAVRLSRLQSKPRYRMIFPAQPGSAGQIYRLLVESDAPSNTVSLLASRQESYPGGDLYLNGMRVERDLAFRTFSAVTLPGLARSLLVVRIDFAFCLALTILFALVGAAFLMLAGLSYGLARDEAWIWSLGAGLALAVVLFIGLGSTTIWVMLALTVLAALRLGAMALRRCPGVEASQEQGDAAPRSSTPFVPLLLLFAWSLVVRLIQVEGLTAPLWMDGREHVAMIESIRALGGVPRGLLYHIGFHSIVALLDQWVTVLGIPGFSLPHLTLLVGQWISALTGLAVYPFARRLLNGSSGGAFFAALFLSSLAAFPGYVFNWGRYPFLLGLTLLPLVLAALIDLSNRLAARDATKPIGSRRSPWGAGLLAALLTLGMTLSHYGTLAFVLPFTLVWLGIDRPAWLANAWRRRAAGLKVAAGGIALVGLALGVGMLRFGPELFTELGGKIAATVAESRQANADLDYHKIIGLQAVGPGLIHLLAGAAGGIAAAVSNRRLLGLTAGWYLVQVAFIALQAPFLGYALASYGNLLMALALPLAVLAGSLAVVIGGRVHPQPGRRYRLGILREPDWWARLAGVGIALAGGAALTGLLNPAVTLYGPQDERAMQWIRENTPPAAAFLVNSNYWGSMQVLPSDGGGWIEIMTGRRMVSLDRRPEAGELEQFIRQEGVSYVLLGRFTGFLSESELAGEAFEQVYDQGGVKIYRVRSVP